MPTINVAGFHISFRFRDYPQAGAGGLRERFDDRFPLFAVPDRESADLTYDIALAQGRYPGTLCPERLYRSAGYYVEADDRGSAFFFAPQNAPGDSVGYHMTLSGGIDAASVTEYAGAPRMNTLRYVCRQAFEAFLIPRGAFTLHSSAVLCGSRAVAFAGASGAGKSTQSRLWSERNGTPILNGDSPVVRADDGRLYGSPWCGSSGESMNASAPLAAIALVVQADVNEARLLSGPEAFWGVFPHIRKPVWSARHVDASIEMLNGILKTTAVVELKCRPDYDAVAALEQCLHREGILS